MYCKHCGKQIADDSTFCQHCGGKVIEVSSSEVNSGVSQANNEQSESAQEVVVATKEANPIQVEISKKGKDNSSTIANEIVGNLKMVGISAGNKPLETVYALHIGGIDEGVRIHIHLS